MEKRKAVYNPEAQKRWDDANRDRKRYYTDRTSARRFIRTKAELEDLDELEKLIQKRRKVFPNELDKNNQPV